MRALAHALIVVVALASEAVAAPGPTPTPSPAPAPAPETPPPASTGADAAKAADIFQKAMATARDGKLGEACLQFDEVIKLTPVFGLAQYEVAQCDRLFGDLEDDGIAHITTAEADVKRPPIYIERGRLLEDRGDKAGAAAAYKEALALLPAEVRAQAGMARVTEASEGKAALERLQVYTQSNPTDPAGWKKLAEIAEAQKKWQVAEDALTQLVSVAKNKKQAIAALYAFGARAKKKDVVDKAIEMWRATK